MLFHIAGPKLIPKLISVVFDGGQRLAVILGSLLYARKKAPKSASRPAKVMKVMTPRFRGGQGDSVTLALAMLRSVARQQKGPPFGEPPVFFRP